MVLSFLLQQWNVRRTSCIWLVFAFWALGTVPVRAQGNARVWEWEWAQKLAGGTSNSTCSNVVADANGNSYVTGRFNRTAQFGGFTLTNPTPYTQVYVAKLDASGVCQWVTTVGNSGSGEGLALALDDTGNIYVTGTFFGALSFGSTTLQSLQALPNSQSTGSSLDVFVAKLSPSGTWLWASAGGSPSHDYVRSIVVSTTGMVYVTGQIRDQGTFGSTSTTLPGQSLPDTYVAALNASTGTWQWARSVPAAGTNSVNNSFGVGQGGVGLGLDAAGAIYVMGNFSGQATFGSTTLTTQSSSLYVAKLSATGNWLWARRTGSSGPDNGNAMAVDGAGNVYLTGTVRAQAVFGSTVLGNAGEFVAKMDSGGNWLWAKLLETNNYASGRGIGLDVTGQHVSMMGLFMGTLTFGTLSKTVAGVGLYAIGLDTSGNGQWIEMANGGLQGVLSMTTAPNGVLYAVGQIASDTYFGLNVLQPTPGGNDQPYIARLAPRLATAVAAPNTRRLATWPSPAAPAQSVRVSWAADQHPTALVLRDALGREVYRQLIKTPGALGAAFPAPQAPGWYHCQLLLANARPVSSRLVVQP